jgi:predicted phage tail component-like protein
MANSITYNGTDLSTYNLIVTAHNMPGVRETTVARVENKGIAGNARLVPANLSFEVIIQGTSVSNVMGLVDSIKAVLNTGETAVLTVGLLSDRYWMAKFVSMIGDLVAQKYWRGTISFLAPDPLSYGTTEEDSDYDLLTDWYPLLVGGLMSPIEYLILIDVDPCETEITPVGSAVVSPVFSLTAGEDMAGITVSLQNEETSEEITWTGTIVEDEVLEIDTENWTVKLEGGLDMANVSGDFPTLLHGTANTIIVTGFGTLGSMNVVYRERYL